MGDDYYREAGGGRIVWSVIVRLLGFYRSNTGGLRESRCRQRITGPSCKAAPCIPYEGYGEVERNLSFAELRQLLPELKTWRTAERNRRLVRFLLASGQRASAVLEMRWSELDLHTGVWTLPASSKERHSKSRVARRIPLSGYMLDILELQRGEVSHEVELVWPRPTTGQQMLAADVRGLIKRNLPEGMEQFTPP